MLLTFVCPQSKYSPGVGCLLELIQHMKCIRGLFWCYWCFQSSPTCPFGDLVTLAVSLSPFIHHVLREINSYSSKSWASLRKSAFFKFLWIFLMKSVLTESILCVQSEKQRQSFRFLHLITCGQLPVAAYRVGDVMFIQYRNISVPCQSANSPAFIQFPKNSLAVLERQWLVCHQVVWWAGRCAALRPPSGIFSLWWSLTSGDGNWVQLIRIINVHAHEFISAVSEMTHLWGNLRAGRLNTGPEPDPTCLIRHNCMCLRLSIKFISADIFFWQLHIAKQMSEPHPSLFPFLCCGECWCWNTSDPLV